MTDHRQVTVTLEELIERVERDLHEPDKLLCHLRSAKSALLRGGDTPGEVIERCPTCLSRNPWFTHCKDPGVAEEETGRTPPPLRERGPSCSDPWHDQTQPSSYDGGRE